MPDWVGFFEGIGGLVQTIAAPVMVYLVWDLKSNHIPHMYARLGEVEKGIARINGFNEAQTTRKG